jgi:hypothetical protein
MLTTFATTEYAHDAIFVATRDKQAALKSVEQCDMVAVEPVGRTRS